jgi:8-oxo-dGTP pyrophosphatase MutT (NUDIX family)
VSERYPVWTGDGFSDLPVAGMAGEALVVPNVAALVVPELGSDRVLLQRRDKPGEAVRGRLEIPTGRWRAGESPEQALRREVAEETGLIVSDVVGAGRRVGEDPRRPNVIADPEVVTVGVEGAYPALLLAFVCVAPGIPRPQPGETLDPEWYLHQEVRDRLRTPASFTGAAYAVLTHWLG